MTSSVEATALNTRRKRRRSRFLAFLVPLTLVGLLLLPTTAANAAPIPAPPTGIVVTAATDTSFTVTFPAVANATEYRLYATTIRDDIHVVNIDNASSSAFSSSTTLTVTGLTYTTAPYNFRVEDANPYHRNWSDIMQTYLQPGKVANVGLLVKGKNTYLTWSGESASGYEVAQSTTTDLVQDRYEYILRSGDVTRFTPYGMTYGKTYYFRVRALNGTTVGHFSSLETAVNGSDEQYARVMTFNIRSIDDGPTAGAETISPWSERRITAAKLINQASPDVIGIQEGASWVAAARGPRQVDDLVTAVGASTYTLARTEIPPSQPNYRRTGDYIIYKTSTYSAVGSGGSWDIGGVWGVYQELKNRVSGARVLFINTHLSGGSGATYDAVRKTQTTTLINDATKLAATDGNIPIVYVGDFNSDLSSDHAYDGSSEAMFAAGAQDALVVARFQTNPQYDSANLYERTPPAVGFSIDHIYAPLGVGVRSWKLYQDMSNGSFVGTIPSDHDPIVSDVSFPYIAGGSS